MNASKLPTRQQMNAAVNALKAAGWEHILTSMSASGNKDPHGYGLLFAREGERFWLNKDTIERLPA